MCWASVPFLLVQEWACARVLLMWWVRGGKALTQRGKTDYTLLMSLDGEVMCFSLVQISYTIFLYFDVSKRNWLSDVLVFLDADLEGWSTAFVKKWLQTDLSPTSIANMLFSPAESEQYVM